MALLKSATPITPKSIPITVHLSSLLNFGVTAGGGVGGGRPPVNTVLNIPRLILDNLQDYFYEKILINVGEKSKKVEKTPFFNFEAAVWRRVGGDRFNFLICV